MKFIEDIKKTYEFYRDRAFLKKHGCESWKQYHKIYDPDCNPRASRIRDYYHGYPYVYCFENRHHEVYDWDVGRDGAYVLDKWCEKHCRDKYRIDFHRVLKAPSTANEWEMNDIGGSDYIFIAFKEQRDYTWCLMRWS